MLGWARRSSCNAAAATSLWPAIPAAAVSTRSRRRNRPAGGCLDALAALPRRNCVSRIERRRRRHNRSQKAGRAGSTAARRSRPRRLPPNSRNSKKRGRRTHAPARSSDCGPAPARTRRASRRAAAQKDERTPTRGAPKAPRHQFGFRARKRARGDGRRRPGGQAWRYRALRHVWSARVDQLTNDGHH
jgi:hypothetical protein